MALKKDSAFVYQTHQITIKNDLKYQKSYKIEYLTQYT